MLVPNATKHQVHSADLLVTHSYQVLGRLHSRGPLLEETPAPLPDSLRLAAVGDADQVPGLQELAAVQ